MKKITHLFYLLLIINAPTGLAHNNDTVIKRLIEQSDYFQLQEQFPHLKEQSSELIRLQAEAVIGSYFNLPEAAIQAAYSIFTKYNNELDPQTWVNLMSQMGVNYARIGYYTYAVQVLDQIIQYVSPIIDSIALQSLVEYRSSNFTFSKVPPLKMSSFQKSVIPFVFDTIGLMLIPVSNQKDTLYFVLDFGAPICMISEEYAKRMGITILEDSILLGGLTGVKKYPKVGFAEEIQIGDILFNNVLFAISTEKIIDSIPSFKDYEIKGIIGMPLLQKFEHLNFSKEGKITFSSSKKEESIRPNLILYHNTLFVNANSSKEDLFFMFDSGALISELSENYYEKNKDNANIVATDPIERVGFGGSVRYKPLLQKNLDLNIGTSNFHFDSIYILLNSNIIKPFPIDGVLGIDIFKGKKEMTIDLKNMYMDFKD